MSALNVGLKHQETMLVEEKHLVPQVEPNWSGFDGMPPVFATAMMIGFMEQTCILALRPYLESGQNSVGISVEMSHVSASPIGETIKSEIELEEIDGKILQFVVRCHDSAGLIGEGRHKRAIIDVERFVSRLREIS